MALAPLAVAATPTAAVPMEAPANLSAADETAVRSFFDKFGVGLATQDRLIAEFEAGGRWDSMSVGSVARSTTVRNLDGVSWSVSTYSDGSVKAEGIGSDTGSARGINQLGVNGCNYVAGRYGNFSGCHIYYWVGVVQMGFYADFTIAKGAYDKITSAWGGTLFAGGACGQTVPEARIVKKSESSTGKAVAGLTAQATMCGTGFTVNFPSYLHVGGNRATHNYN
jgi:hypothetical protein